MQDIRGVNKAVIEHIEMENNLNSKADLRNQKKKHLIAHDKVLNRQIWASSVQKAT